MDPQLDPMTGLYYPDPSLAIGEQLLAETQASNGIMGLIYADIDGMREVNNLLGFTGGDRLIVKIAQVILAHLPGGAMAGRIKGDEFLMVVPIKSEDYLEALAEAIREEAKAVTVMGGHLDEVVSDPATLTLGLSCFPHHGTDLKSLWIAAEAAAMQGKDLGRDRVCWANSI